LKFEKKRENQAGIGAQAPIPDLHLPTADLTMLTRRAKLLRTVRHFFDTRDFIEVDTPILSADTVVDRHLEPFTVDVSGSTFFLQTSPEFAMKRLLAAGMTAIYQITHAFRRDEFGQRHNPEFTMIEWYRVGDTYPSGMDLLAELAEATLNRGPTERLTYAEAFDRHIGIDPHTADAARLLSAIDEQKIDAEGLDPTDRDGLLDLLLTHRIEPHLGVARPTILYDYPASQSALAKVRDDGPENPPVAERFELYVDSIELANGYHELTDPAELRRRNAAVNDQRAADGHARLPEESRLLSAMDAGLPESVGVALGFDRLLMAATGAKRLSQVIPFPFDRA
jgi:lysyl-tRNA synthetase class 2